MDASGGAKPPRVHRNPPRALVEQKNVATAGECDIPPAGPQHGEHARRGPDGKWHDAFLPADFTVRPGHKVTITFNNYDGGAHTFTSPAMGVNAIIPGGGSVGAPHKTTFTFTAPTKPGKYAWYCAVPCDPWAMAHDGFMRGYVTVKA